MPPIKVDIATPQEHEAELRKKSAEKVAKARAAKAAKAADRKSVLYEPMQQAEQRGDVNAVNDMLCRMGLGGLDDKTIIHQIAFLCKDQKTFSKMLLAQNPEKRYAMYEAMRPHLRFKVLPFDRAVGLGLN